MWRRVGSNAIANLLAGVSGMVFQIGVTAIASRSFGQSGFSIWALVFSMAALVPLFSANLSTIVTRRLLETSPEHKAAVISSSQKLAYILSCAAILVIALTGLPIQQYSPILQDIGIGHFITLILLLITSQLWLVILQPTFGLHYAKEQNWRASRAIVCARIGGLIGLGLACGLKESENLIGAALGLLFGTAIGLFGAGLSRNPASHHLNQVQNETAVMMPLLKAFAVWSAGAAVIQFGLPPLMSLLAPQSFNAFYLAYTLNLVVVGIIGAASLALLTPITRQRLNGATTQLERLLTWAPLAIGLVLVGSMLLIWHSLPLVLSIWTAQMASPEDVRPPLFWLALQTLARSMTMVHSVLLSSAGKPGQMTKPILLELTLVVLIAMPVGWVFGPNFFLAALAAAGLLTALYTVWTTLNLGISRVASLSSMGMAFAGAQTFVLGLWILATR